MSSLLVCGTKQATKFTCFLTQRHCLDLLRTSHLFGIRLLQRLAPGQLGQRFFLQGELQSLENWRLTTFQL
ncbi:MAG: hypothetical protein CME13_14390 [Gemmatimonadetes bacterium]|nr:hypothetical protein [Gemmatimonadota bacterium]